MADPLNPSLSTTRTLDRLHHMRSDRDAMMALLRSGSSRFLILVDGCPVIHSNAERTHAELRWWSYSEVSALIEKGTDWAVLGREGASAPTHFAVFVRSLDITEENIKQAPYYPAVDLRSLATQGLLTPDEQSLAGQATALAHWHANTRCCARCGGQTASDEAGWRRRCRACTYIWFPRMDPAVIMLVTDGNRAVLAHEARFPENMYSTLAGFVEPGDDIANAVRRETFEEVGLNVLDVAFLGAQPWPFPHTLMLGCIATAEPSDLKPDPNELEDARWFTHHELQLMHEGKHPDGLWFPGKQSIAYELIMHFLKTHR